MEKVINIAYDSSEESKNKILLRLKNKQHPYGYQRYIFFRITYDNNFFFLMMMMMMMKYQAVGEFVTDNVIEALNVCCPDPQITG